MTHNAVNLAAHFDEQRRIAADRAREDAEWRLLRPDLHSALTCPLEDLPILEPLPPALRIDFPTHEDFMRERGFDAWLAWQMHRTPPVASNHDSPAVVDRRRDPKGRFAPRAAGVPVKKKGRKR